MATDDTKTLCSLCLSIPWDSLPQLPLCWKGTNVGGRSIYYSDLSASSAPNVPLGFPYHSSLKALAASADNCGLCDIISNSVDQFVASCRTAENELDFTYYANGRLPADFNLWLTKRVNSGDGFLVLVRAPLEGVIYLVGAVGFCVRDGMPLCV